MEIPLPPITSDETCTEVCQFLLKLAMLEGEEAYSSVRKVLDRWIMMRKAPETVRMEMQMEQEMRERKSIDDAAKFFFNFFATGSNAQNFNGDLQEPQFNHRQHTKSK